MWSYIVVYRKEGPNMEYTTDFVKTGGKYHSEMVARSLLAVCISRLTEDCHLISAKMVFVPSKGG